MHRVNRCTLADTVWAPTSSNRAPAHCYPLPGRPPCRPPHPCLAPLPAPLGLRFRALLGLGFVPPPEPWPCAHCASIAYALLPAARVPLCRHRADPESSSRSLPSGSPVRIAPVAPTVRRHPRHPPHLSPRVAAAPGPWLARTAPYASLFAECAKKAPFLATSARNACFSRSRWQHPRPMHPFPGAIGRFRIHGARILPPRALFRVEESEITHGAKMLPAPPGLSAAAACGPAERALRHATAACGPAGRALRPAAQAWPACRMRPPCHLACARRGLRSGRTGFAPCSRASPSETRHAVPVPMHLATCAPHPSRQPRAPTASRKQAEQHKQLNAGIKIGSPNGDPIEELFGFAQRLPDALQSLHQANELALSYLDHSTRQRLGGYVIGLSGNSFTVDLYAALVDHATSIAR